MGSFVELENGKMGAEVGCFDDCVMALAMARYAQAKAAKMWAARQKSERETFTGRTIEVFEAGRAIEELVLRYRDGGTDAGFPISNQASGQAW